MRSFLFRRLVGAVLTLLIAATVVFVAAEAIPADAAEAILGRNATAPNVAVLRHELGLDEPMITRYWHWLTGIVQLHFGNSITVGFENLLNGKPALGAPVAGLIGGHVLDTMILAGISLALIVPLSILIGVWSGLHEGSRGDGATQVVILALTALPEFVMGVILVIIFAFVWPVLPAVSLGPTPKNLVLPVATLVALSVGYTARFIRAGVVEAAQSDYVALARLKGLPERVVVRRHILPNSVGPSLQAFALVTGWLAGGIVIVEYLFAYPGMGQDLVSAVSRRDLPVIQAYTLILATVYVLANLVADILIILVNPKLRHGL